MTVEDHSHSKSLVEGNEINIIKKKEGYEMQERQNKQKKNQKKEKQKKS